MSQLGMLTEMSHIALRRQDCLEKEVLLSQTLIRYTDTLGELEGFLLKDQASAIDKGAIHSVICVQNTKIRERLASFIEQPLEDFLTQLSEFLSEVNRFSRFNHVELLKLVCNEEAEALGL